MMSQLFLYGFVGLLIIVGFAFMIGGPRAALRSLVVTGDVLVHYLAVFIRWTWRGYWRFIVGFGAGVLATLYFTGYLH